MSSDEALYQFIRSDLFQDIAGKYDIIVSNPPYISEKDYNSLDRSVRDFEPEKALLAGYDGCDFYRRITEQLKDHLNPGGTVMFEIGYDQGNAVNDMLDKAEYYLSHDEEREQIAKCGRKAAEKIFSYDVLLPKILII